MYKKSFVFRNACGEQSKDLCIGGVGAGKDLA